MELFRVGNQYAECEEQELSLYCIKVDDTITAYYYERSELVIDDDGKKEYAKKRPPATTAVKLQNT